MTTTESRVPHTPAPITSESTERSVVAIYDSHLDAEAAVRALEAAGIDVRRLSIVGKDFHTEEHAVGFYNTGDRMTFWGKRGAFWGGLAGMMFGSAFFFLPVIGPIAVLGPLVGWMVGALEVAAVGGAGGVLAAALTSIGIPENSIVKYEVALRSGKYLVIARGGPELAAHAHAILGTTTPAHLAAHT